MNFRVKDFFKTQTTPTDSWGKGRRTFGSVSSVDFSLLGTIVALLVIGAVMVYSASISLADSPKYQTSEYFFVSRQLVYIVIGLVAGFCVFKVPINNWDRISYPMALVGILCLILVFMPGLGKSVNGATRWIGFGPINIQVSEIVKFVSILVIARFTVDRQVYMHSFTRGFLPVLAYVVCVAALLAVQPDLGATVVIASIVIGIVFLGGLSWKIIITLGLILVITIVLSVVLSPWRTARVFAYLNPWDPENQIGKAYQLTHSLIAFGRGEIFGVGLGASVEKMHYLPEAHTDFILAVIGEECGLVGFSVVLGLFYWLSLIHI